MALVNGSDYDHIDLHSVDGGDVTRHMLKDAQARQDVSDLKSAFENLSIEDFTRTMARLTGTEKQGYMYDYRGYDVQINGWTYLSAPCQPNTTYLISGTASTSARLYTVLNADGDVIDYAESGATVRQENVQYTTPADAATLIVNANNNQGTPSVYNPGQVSYNWTDPTNSPATLAANKLDKNQGSENAGKFLIVGSNGAVALAAGDFATNAALQSLISRFDQMAIQGYERGNTPVEGTIKNNYMYDRRGYETPLNRWSYLSVSCQPNTTYLISGTASTNARLYTVLNADGEVIDLAESDTTVRKENVSYTTPADAVTLIVNAANSQGAPTVTKPGDNFVLINQPGSPIGTETSEGVYTISGSEFSTQVDLHGTPNNTVNLLEIDRAGSVFKSANDDSCPVNFLEAAYVGANHGFYYGFNLTIASHGLTASNIGTVYNDAAGGYNWLLLSIVDSNTVLVCALTSNRWYGMANPAASAYPASVDFGTGALTVSACTKTQICPSVKDVVISVAENSAERFAIAERYSIIDIATGLAYIQSHVGSNDNTSFCDHADALINVQNKYTFDLRGNCVISCNLVADKAARLNFFGGTQSKAFSSNDQFCVLGTDYGVLTALSGSAIYFTRTTWNAENTPPVCYVQANGAKTAYTSLFVTVILANSRNEDIANNAGFYHTTHKMYPFAVEPAAEIPAGTGYGLTALRLPIYAGTDQQAFAYCQAGGKWYAFMAMRSAGAYHFAVPDEISGLTATVIASSNCTLAADVAVGTFDVFATNEAYMLISLD